MKITLPGKEIASLSWGAAVGRRCEGGGFAAFFDEEGNVFNELTLSDEAEFVSCEESVCAIYYENKIMITSKGSPLMEFEVEVVPTWITLSSDKIYITHDEGVVAYGMDGKKAWRCLCGPTKGAATVKRRLYVGSPSFLLVLDKETGKVLDQIELGSGEWRVASSCSSSVLVVNDVESKAVALLVIKELGEPEVLGEVSGVVGTPSLSPDCLYVAAPGCGYDVYDVNGNLLSSKRLEGATDECFGVQTHWGEKLLAGVFDEGLTTSYILIDEFPTSK